MDIYNFNLKMYLYMEYSAKTVNHIFEIVLSKNYLYSSLVLFQGISRVTNVTLLLLGNAANVKVHHVQASIMLY